MSKKPNILDYKRIAIIQTAFIGDVVLALPLADAIKKINPDSKITFVTTPQSVELPAILNSIDNVISYDKRGLNEGLRGVKFISQVLKEKKIDCIIAPHRSLRTSLVIYYSKPELSVTFNKSSLSMIYDYRVKYRLDLHEIERNFSLLSVFENEIRFVDLNQVEYSINSDDIDFAEALIDYKNDLKYIAIAPGSVWATKRWKIEYFQEIVEYFSKDFKLILLGSNNDKPIADEIKSNNIINLCGKTTLSQTIHILSKMSFLITNDSSPTHLAGLTNTPTITIYGPTSPLYGFYPRAKNSEILVNDTLKCHPCHIHGQQKCPIKTHECMNSITPNMVIEKSKNILSKIDLSSK